LVELVTSEGCSSCPRADALLADLARSQPVEGVRIVVLGEHVDYWDKLGWPDPFALPALTMRQQIYALSFGNDSVYTPQVIVDGEQELVGGDRSEALKAIARAARSPKAQIELELRPIERGVLPEVPLRIRISKLPLKPGGGPAEIWLAVTESGLKSDVSRGENAGLSLRHTGVVREMRPIGRMEQDSPLDAEARVILAPDWNLDRLDAVVFLQERATRRVLGAASTPLRASSR
jgi:hypothetical protein